MDVDAHIARAMRAGAVISAKASDLRSRMDADAAANLGLSFGVVLSAMLIAASMVGIGAVTQTACVPTVIPAPETLKPVAMDTWAPAPFPIVATDAAGPEPEIVADEQDEDRTGSIKEAKVERERRVKETPRFERHHYRYYRRHRRHW